jgi:hypothetical protein
LEGDGRAAAVALFAGRVAADNASEEWLGMLTAFAAGAVLASLADTLMPRRTPTAGRSPPSRRAAGFSSLTR